MKKQYKKWRSPSLGKDMEMLIYGDSGTPVLGLPTRGERCDQWEEEGMVDSISFQLENGFNQLYCIDTVDEESFLNEKVDPGTRILRHQQFEDYVIEEVVPFINDNNPIDFLIIAGVDMGGYHAVNLGLKYPKQFGKSIGISGLYDIKPLLNGFYDDSVYYNNPVDYVPNLNKPVRLNNIRNVDFRLVSFAGDQRKSEAERLADTLRMKMIESELDIWDMEPGDEWSIWSKMIKVHIV